jgi:hypothetical protein
VDLKIQLEDEGLCHGCPFDRVQKECQGGFVRELGKIIETKSSRRDPWTGYRETNVDTVFRPIRPRSCILANERADKATRMQPVKPAESRPSDKGDVVHFAIFDESSLFDAAKYLQSAVEPPKPIKGECKKCKKVHKSWEKCYK